jgi:hypothetical protein
MDPARRASRAAYRSVIDASALLLLKAGLTKLRSPPMRPALEVTRELDGYLRALSAKGANLTRPAQQPHGCRGFGLRTGAFAASKDAFASGHRRGQPLIALTDMVHETIEWRARSAPRSGDDWSDAPKTGPLSTLASSHHARRRGTLYCRFLGRYPLEGPP